MKELIETVVKALVDKPEEVKVTEVAGETAVIYEIKVADSDIGKIIGKQGRNGKRSKNNCKGSIFQNWESCKYPD